MANDNLREDLVKDGDRIKQIEFDFDLIEVMLPCGICFRISERKFVHELISYDDDGKCHLECMYCMTVAHFQTRNTLENPF